MMLRMYQVQVAHRSEYVPIRNLQYHVQVWGEPAPGKVPLVMLHGWMDVAASFQFVVDALGPTHYVIAPDWRGYGQTAGGDVDGFWFPDYLADLDFLLDHYAPSAQVDLIGHSMGGNVAMLYAGVRPERVRRLVNLEGFGMPATRPAQAPGKLAQWMGDLKKLHAGERHFKRYESAAAVASRLMKTNPRLSTDKAHWLAKHWATEVVDGSWRIHGHPAHKVSSAQLYRVDEVLEMYKRISMPVLAVEASDDSMQQWWHGQYTLEQHHERMKVVPQVEYVRIDNAGHMLHHDQPEVLAQHLERFLAA